jgi:dTDP-4-amino-4,6-dideoxygalactose transaminase
VQSIPFNRPDITADDRQHLADAISEGHSSGNGRYTKLVEQLVESVTRTRRTLLTTSCTHALEMSALLCNLKPGDEVIVPSYTFVSTASAFALYGAVPVFVDSRSDTLNIDPSLLEAAITPRTRALCVVHYGGVACEMDALTKIAERHSLVLVEDNAHGLFAKYKSRYLGTFGALATQSFHETKNLTCGEGGALLVNDEKLVERAEILREKGTDRGRLLRGQVDKYTWGDIGSSWVLSDLLAAILWGQLQRADVINARRIAIWNRYHLCPTSNVNTVVCKSIAEHPIGMLRRLRFRVTLNTDNRLMSNTSMTREFTQCTDAFGWTLDDFQWITVNSVKSAFAQFEERLRLINEVVKPRYATLRSQGLSAS